jgi:hypothetical protein
MGNIKKGKTSERSNLAQEWARLLFLFAVELEHFALFEVAF